MKILFRAISILCCAAPLVLWVAASAADQVAELQKAFDREQNSVHKAKVLQKLGQAQFGEARRAQQAGDFGQVGLTWEKYRDNVRTCLEMLEKQHPDAEKKSNGYRQLEFSVREGLREIDQTILEAPDEYTPPLRLVRKDLSAFDEEMIRRLFPRRVEHAPAACQRLPETEHYS